MANITVEAVALTKRFADRRAIEDVSFSAAQGEVLGLLGPNGAGKTTLIRLLTTVLTPTNGEFRVAGQPSTAPTEIRRRIGVLPESSGYPGHQTGRDHLRYFARLYGLSGGMARRLTDDLLAQVGLEDRASTRISSYSRGMRQRLGIARALVNNPTVVFLDEPTLGLDPAGQSQVLEVVRDISKSRNATVVLSTHTLPEVEQLCSRVLVLDRGKALISGSVPDVIAAAIAERYAQLRVPIDLVERTKVALAGISDLTVDQLQGRPDVLRITRRGPSSTRSAEAGEAMNAALVAVARANVPVLSYEVEGARLSDAFLKLTSEAVK